jgi:hypothetical protein
VADLRLTLVNSVVATAGVNGGSTVNPTISRIGLTLANLSNTFYVGSVNSVNTSLPITLISFTASVVGKLVELNWSTSSEINNNFYTVQRSKDAVIWEGIQQVAGAGNSKTISSYREFDQNPFSGKSYYRLMQTDRDGKESYSAEIAVRLDKISTNSSVYPNPARENITITFPVSGRYEITLFNRIGQIADGPLVSTGNNLILPVSNRVPGVYFVVIRSKDTTETKEIIIGK